MPAKKLSSLTPDQSIPTGAVLVTRNPDMSFGVLPPEVLATEGPPGIGVAGMTRASNGHLVVTLTDGSKVDAGLIPAGPPGQDGQSGTGVSSAAVNGSRHLILTLSDGTPLDAGQLPAATPSYTPGTGNPALTTRLTDQDGNTWTIAQILALAAGSGGGTTPVPVVTGLIELPSGALQSGNTVNFQVEASAYPAYVSLMQGGLTSSRTAVNGAGSIAYALTSAGTAVISLYADLNTSTALSSKTFTISAAAQTTPPSTGNVAQIVDDFSLKNTGSATSPGFHRGGVVFARGLVPAGTSLQVKRGSVAVSAQFDERRTWKDGSLKYAVMHMRDADIGAGVTVQYDIWTVPNTAFNNTGSVTPGQIMNGVTSASTPTTGNYKVKFQNLTESDNSSTAPVGSGNFVAYFADHIAKSTRITKIHSGPVVDGYMVWGMARDVSSSGAGVGLLEDPHLKTNWYVDAWKNADGTVYAHEVGAVVAQDSWSTPNKKRRNYDASLTAGFGSGTVVQAYPGISHINQSQWLTAVMSGDNVGKRPWVGGTQPTLLYKTNKPNWVASGVIPSLNVDRIPVRAPYSTTYVPCGGTNHRTDIDGTGAYAGRGVLTDCDGLAFMRQSQADIAAGRVAALAALGVPYHFRSNRTRIRPEDNGVADIANTIVSPRLSVSDGSHAPYDFTSDGMPVPVIAQNDFRSSSAFQDGYVQPTGGEAPWSTHAYPGSSHGSNYPFYFYLLEGDRYLLEALLDIGVSYQHRQVDGEQPLTLATGIADPGTRWTGINDLLIGQERQFSMGILASGAGILPNTHVAFRQMQAIIAHHGRYMTESLKLLPASYRAAGAQPHIQVGSSCWQNSMSILCWLHAYKVAEATAFLDAAGVFINQAVLMATDQPYLTTSYHVTSSPRISLINSTTNQPTTKWLTMDYEGTIDAATDVVTVKNNYPYMTNGDKILIADVDGAGAVAPCPPELTKGNTYYLVNVNSSDRTKCQLSATLNGPPINFGADGGIVFGCNTQARDALVMAYPPYMGGADDYGTMAKAALIEANACGIYKATPALIQKMSTFLAPVDMNAFTTWDYKRTPVDNPAPAAPGSFSMSAGTPTQTTTRYMPTAPGPFTLTAGNVS